MSLIALRGTKLAWQNRSERSGRKWARNHSLGTEQVPQRTFATKILTNFRVNFLVRFASKPLFYWVMPTSPLKLFRKFFGTVRALFCFGVPFWPLNSVAEIKWGFGLAGLKKIARFRG